MTAPVPAVNRSASGSECCSECEVHPEFLPDLRETELVAALSGPPPPCRDGPHALRIMDFFLSGVLIAVAYVDPGNLESDFVGGAKFGMELTWVLVWVTIMGGFVQSLAVRLGLGSGMDLARCCREEYSYPVRILLWLASEVAIIACDIPEVLGASIGLRLITGLPTLTCILLTGIISVALLSVQMLGLRYFEGMVAICLLVVAGSFVGEWAFSHVPIADVVYHGIVPMISGTESLYVALSIIGAIVMPHNLYLQSATVLYRRPTGAAEGRSRNAMRKIFNYHMGGTGLALGLSVIMNIACMATAHGTAGRVGPMDRKQLADSPLLNAPRMLNHVLGKAAGALFAVSLLLSGQSATLTGVLAGQYVMEGFLELKVGAMSRAIIARFVALIPAVGVSLIWGDAGSEGLILFSSVLLAFQLPFALIPLIKFVSTEKYVGHMKLGFKGRILSYVLAAFFIGCNLVMVASSVRGGDLLKFRDPRTAYLAWASLAAVMIAYVAAIAALTWRPMVGCSLEARLQLPHSSIGGEDAGGMGTGAGVGAGAAKEERRRKSPSPCRPRDLLEPLLEPNRASFEDRELGTPVTAEARANRVGGQLRV